MLIYFDDGLRSFFTFYKGSVGQRAANLLAVKVGGKKSGPGPELNHVHAARVRPRLGPNHSQSFIDRNFAAL